MLRVPSPGALLAVLTFLAARWRELDPSVRDRITFLYAELRQRYAPTISNAEQQAAAISFVDSILGVPELREDLERQLGSAAGAEFARPIELPERIEDLAPRQRAMPPAAAAPPPPMAIPFPAPAAPAPAGPAAKTRGLKKRPKAATKNGGGATRALRPGEAVAADGGGPPEERPPLTRYPEVDVPPRIALGSRESITVAVRLQPSDPRTAAAAMSIPDTVEEPPVLEVVLRAPGFEVDGSNTQEITVSRDEDVETRFVVRAVREGPATIRADFYHAGRRVGTVRADTVVGAGALAAAAAASDPLELAADPTAAPDLEICVQLDGQRLIFTLHSTREQVGFHHAPMGSVELNASSIGEIRKDYEELSKMAGKAPKTEAIEAQRKRLAALGNKMWERLFSDQLKESYWSWRDRVRSILVTSDEPWMPWEIVKPFRFDERDQRIDEPHLCERFALSRWLSGPAPADRITVRTLQPVAPRTTDLAAVDAELKTFERLAQVRPGLRAEQRFAQRAQLIDAFERGTFSILHVASHGSFDASSPDNSAIALSDGELRPSDINARFGGARPRPVVFINACHGARLEHALTGIGGWAERLIKQARVGAFVGAAWEVNDRLALAFADRFYRALLGEGRTVGESFRLAREAIRDAEPSNSTWLAYVLYSDPTTNVAPAG